MSNTVTATAKTFSRIANGKAVREMVKEAKRVGYVVATQRGDDLNPKGAINGYTVTDDASGDLVFKAMKFTSAAWMVRFSTAYWQQPTV